MKKKIMIAGEPCEIDYSSVNAFKVLDLVIEWMEQDKHGASLSGEGILQDDTCIADAPVLIADIIDKVLKPEYLGCE